MTYRELLSRLKMCSEEQLDQNVTAHNAVLDEFFPVSGFFATRKEDYDSADGILDVGHLYLETDG